MYRKHYKRLEEAAYTEGRAAGHITGFVAGVVTAAALCALAMLVWL